MTEQKKTGVPTRKEQEDLLRHCGIPYSPEEHLRAASEIVERNGPFLAGLAQKYVRAGFSFDDAMQAAKIGFLKAIKKFDFSFGARLTTYATWLVRAEIKRDMRESSRTIRVPIPQWIRRQRAKDILRKDPAARLTDMQRAALDAFARTETSSLQKKVRKCNRFGFELTVQDTIVGTCDAPDSRYDVEQAKALLIQAQKVLDARELDIIKRRFGLAGKEHTHIAISELHGISRERIRQLESQALKKLLTAMQRLGYAA